LGDHNFIAEAEQDYRLAIQLERPVRKQPIDWQLLAANGREDEGKQIVDSFQQRNPTINAMANRRCGTRSAK
jgi:hypothetical protein